MANFLFGYVFAALACAKRFAHVQLLGMGIVPFATTASSILAAVATGALMWATARRLRIEPQLDAHSRFIRLVALGASGLALLALVWVALPPLLIGVSCS